MAVSRRRWIVVGIAILVPIVAFVIVRHSYCPSLTVPKSHFVKPQQHKKVVIFVHGVIADMDNAWINAANKASWPE